MKIALLSDYYPAYLDAFRARNDLSRLAFAERRERLLADRFGLLVSYRNWLRRLGHDAEMIVSNDYPLQQEWLDERGERLKAGPATRLDVVLRQLADMRPDVLFAASMFDYYGSFFARAAATVKTIVGWIACPYPKDLDFSNVRCVLSSVNAFVEDFRARGLRSEVLAAAFDEDVLGELGPGPQNIDVSFVGALGGAAHRFRLRSLEELLERGVPLALWGYGLGGSSLPFLRSRLRRAFRGEAWGLDMFRTLARSRITLNFHIDVAKAANFGGNMRVFEATGCGSLLITDTAPNLERVFEPGVEIETYRNMDELAEKIRHYLDHPAEREAIARRGQRACLERQSFAMRTRELERILVEIVS